MIQKLKINLQPLHKNQCQFQNNQNDEREKNIQNTYKLIQLGNIQKELIDSLKRQYQLKLNKEQQYRKLIQEKFNQQVQILKIQNQALKVAYQQLANDFQKSNEKCNDCRNSQIVKIQANSQQFFKINVKDISYQHNLKKMLVQLQKEHDKCIQNKKNMLNTFQTLQLKAFLLQKQNNQLSNQLKQYKKNLNSLKEIEIQNSSFRKQIEKLRTFNEEKQRQFLNELNQLQKAVQKAKQNNDNSNQTQKFHKNKENNFCLKNFADTYSELIKQRNKNSALMPVLTHQKHKFEEKDNFKQIRLSYLKNKEQGNQKEMIQSLYSKNIQFFKQPVKKQQTNRTEGQKLQNIEQHSITSIPRIPYQQVNSHSNKFLFSSKFKQFSSNNTNSTNRRFRYL